MNLLIVENGKTCEASILEKVITWEHECFLAVDLAEITECIQQKNRRYDLCIINLKGLLCNGIELIHVVRECSYYLPLMVCDTHLDHKKRCIEVGADNFLVLPLDDKSLRNKIEQMGVKQSVLIQKEDSLSLCRRGPVDGDELAELIKLDTQGLAKFLQIDISCFHTHKSILSKLAYDFTYKNPLLTEILDRTGQEENLIQIYASQITIRKTKLTSQQLRQKIDTEDQRMEQFNKAMEN